MKIHDVQAAIAEVKRKGAANPRGRANLNFGRFNNYSVGLGRYSGKSPWERHLNGDELLYVLESEVEITLLSDSGDEHEVLCAGCLFVVPKGIWHQLDTSAGVMCFSLARLKTAQNEREMIRVAQTRALIYFTDQSWSDCVELMSPYRIGRLIPTRTW
jgi:mannose-6-phosphate isomerase-like protein (cupin superfamily)